MADNPLLGAQVVDTDTSASTKQLIKLTYASGKLLLEQQARAAGYQGKFTAEQVASFVDKYNKEADKQAAAVKSFQSQRVTGGVAGNELQKVNTSTTQTQTPSYLDPNVYADDFIWSQINFKDATSGGKALDAMTKVRNIVRDSGNMEVSDIEMQNYARQIGRNLLSVEGFTAIMNQNAIKKYPHLADRLTKTPGATVKSLVQPYISELAKVLELPIDSIDLNNPYLQKAIRPDGTAGKLPMLSIPDFTRMLMETPEWQNTKDANFKARDAATGLGRAFGLGV